MGKFLNQCCDDAWDVIRGRKKIIGKKIFETESFKEAENKVKEEYGWLAPDGTFYPVEFGKHQAWASKYLSGLYREDRVLYERTGRKCNENVVDLLTDMGWILIHNPHGYGFKITRNLSKRVTNKQKDYLCKIGKSDELEKDFV